MNLQAAAPEIFILAAVSTILMVDLFLDDAHRHWSYLLTLLSLGVAAVLTFANGSGPTAHAFNGMFVADRMATVLKLFVYIGVATVLVYSRLYTRSRQLFRGEFFALACSPRWACWS